jgi:hypothetical protein
MESTDAMVPAGRPVDRQKHVQLLDTNSKAMQW